MNDKYQSITSNRNRIVRNACINVFGTFLSSQLKILAINTVFVTSRSGCKSFSGSAEDLRKYKMEVLSFMVLAGSGWGL